MEEPKKIEVFVSQEDGIELSIYHTNDSELPFGFRYFDIDSGNVVGIYHCPTLELAKKHFDDCKKALTVLPPTSIDLLTLKVI